MKKAESSSSSSSGSVSSGGAEEEPQDKRDAKRRKGEIMKEKDGKEDDAEGALPVDLPPPEEGIQRFEYSVDESGPLGLRFSAGFPPLILEVKPDSMSAKKGVPATFEVHAINGLALVPQNRESVMQSLKARPLTLDVRPQGWKPQEKIRELEKKREREEAEKKAIMEVESQRREQVAKEQREQDEKDAVERAERQAREKRQQDEAERTAREARAQQKARDEDFTRAIEADPEPLRKAASNLMEAQYGTDVQVEGRRGLPLRLLTRRREVAWLWAGKVMELIGGGVPDAVDSWS